jgi:hypothetical protein
MVGRITTALAISVIAVLASVAPAGAQVHTDNGKHLGWYKNGKANDKQAKRAARLGRQQDDGVVVQNGTVIDRNRTRTTAQNRYQYRNGYYYDQNGRRYTQRNGYYYDQNGNRVYDYRNGGTYDPYSTYPQYRRQTYPYYGNSYPNGGYYGNSYPNGGYYGNGYPYGNSGYYDNREGDKDREDVARAAAQNGYYAGFERGQYDAQRGNRANPQGHGAFQFGFDGFDPSWGSAQTYQQTYRQYFIQGYNDAYSRRSYTNRFPRRRF